MILLVPSRVRSAVDLLGLFFLLANHQNSVQSFAPRSMNYFFVHSPHPQKTFKRRAKGLGERTATRPHSVHERFGQRKVQQLRGHGDEDALQIAHTTHERRRFPSEEKTREESSTFPQLPFPTALLSLCLVVSIIFLPVNQPAHAGFGPTGGATTSPVPGVNRYEVQTLSNKKLKQLIETALEENSLNDFRSQLDAVIDGISNTLTNPLSGDDSSEEGSEDETEEYQQQKPKRSKQESDAYSNEQLEFAKSLEEEIIARGKLLDKLEAQPKWFTFLAAFCGSVASTLVMHPVDTVKTRLQMQTSNSTEQQSPFEDLYEGLSSNIFKEGPPSALYLGVYEAVKSALLNGQLAPFWGSIMGGSPTYLLTTYLIAGAAGEMIGSTVRAPAETVKSLVQTRVDYNTVDAVQSVFGDQEGRQRLRSAWSAIVCRDVPFGAIQLALFELIKLSILNNPNIDFDSGTLQAEALIGAFAGGFGAFVTNPVDVITTRIITQESITTEHGREGELADTHNHDNHHGLSNPQKQLQPSLGVFKMAKMIYEEEGIAAFFSGWQARVLYWAPAISIFLTCYCSVRQLGIKFDWFS